MGGKRRLADRLIPLFPPHECYVEVFAGGAALYFMKPQPSAVEVLNDINGDLVTLYRVVQNHLEEFVRQFKWALSSRQVFEWQKMTRPETLTDIQRAARFFYLQHHAFAGKVTGQTFGTATTGPAINLLRIEETSRPPGSACPAPTLKISPGLNVPNAMIVLTPSITWTRLTGRLQVMGWTFRSRTTNAWLTSCAVVRGR
jgi:hypothetical protein